MSDVERNRQLRRRHMHERQAVVFGVLLAGLALVGLGAAAVYTGNIDLPGLDQAIAAAPTPTEVVDPFPCPPVGTLPVAYASVTVNVNNATTRTGLAGATAAALKDRGFAVGPKPQTVQGYEGVARISFGINGIAQAYTLAAQFEHPTLLLLGGTDTTISVALGDQFVALVPEDQVTLDLTQPIPAPVGCTPYDQVTAPAETPAPTATPAAG